MPLLATAGVLRGGAYWNMIRLYQMHVCV